MPEPGSGLRRGGCQRRIDKPSYPDKESSWGVKLKKVFRKIHRWLGLAMALQIMAWMGSGLYFAIFPIETIRGEHLTVEAAALESEDFDAMIPVSGAWATVAAGLNGAGTLQAVSLHSAMGRSWYRFSGSTESGSFARLVNAHNGDLLPFLDAGQVRQLAESSLAVKGQVESIELVEHAAPGAEFRGRQLPLWRVAYSEPESLHLYIDGWTGEVVARRTTRWRIFDFLWMLHIMDFDDRDDFNTPLLQVAAVLGLLVAMTGLVFWAMTTRLFRSRKTRRANQTA